MPSVQFSQSVMSDFLRPHEWQHARLPCPPSNPRICPNSCSSSQWCYPAISSFDFPFSSCSQSLPASESFPISQLFTWGGQNIGISALASVLPNSTQDWSPLEWTGCTSLQSKGLSRVFSNTTYIHMESIKMILMHLCSGKEHYREQTCEHSGGRRKWHKWRS